MKPNKHRLPIPQLTVLATPLLLGLLVQPAFAQEENSAGEPAQSETAPAPHAGEPIKMLDPEQLRSAALAKAQDMDTQVLWLETQQESFLGLFHADSTGNPKGAVILLHDNQTSPDWPELIRPLRLGLPDQGWPTLSIAIPDASLPALPPRDGDNQGETDATPPAPTANDQGEQIRERIDSASRHLLSQGYLRQILLGVGSGAYWAASFAAESNGQLNMSVMMIDPEAPPALGETALLETLGKLQMQVLDLYHGSRHPESLPVKQAQRRQQQALRLHQGDYHQLRLPATPANWKLNNPRLLRQVQGVLLRHVENQPRIRRLKERETANQELSPGAG